MTIVCPDCPCVFCTTHDYLLHRQAFDARSGPNRQDAHQENWNKEMERRKKYE
jgi:hypothetical protein